MIYQITITSSASKEFGKFEHTEAMRILKSIDKLKYEPRPTDCKKLRGKNNEYRIRVGCYRIIYTINDSRKALRITHIKKRSEAY